jgi:hypothetical protein
MSELDFFMPVHSERQTKLLLKEFAFILLTSYRDRGMTFVEIADVLNSERITTPTGKPWTAANIGKTLRRNGGDPNPRRTQVGQ